LRKASAVAAEAQKASDNFKPDATAYAILDGAFDISGCTGAPALTARSGNFTPALQPASALVGDYPVLQKWVKHGTDPQDDLTLVHHRWAQSPRLNAVVLGQTPGQFKISPAWHLSYFDRLWFDGRVSVLLPFFYSDEKRTFFVPPAIWSGMIHELNSVFGNAICYYPDIKQAVRRVAPALQSDMRPLLNKLITEEWFHFKNFYHPFVCDFAKLVNNPLKGIPALMSRETQLMRSTFSFRAEYGPTEAVLAPLTEAFHPTEQVDFTPDGAYAPYNWELFFHAPLLIANALSRNQRHEEARAWYHFIFNPVGVESSRPGAPAMSKYWVTRPFFETTGDQYLAQRIETIMHMLAATRSGPGQALTELKKQVIDWRTNPFEPHRIANYRRVAYQKTVVMKYLDNLIAWGDNLFRQDSMESVNEATQLYVLAAEILGPRPKIIPPRARPPVESFNELETQFDTFSNALVSVENLVPVLQGTDTDPNQPPLPNLLYFCIPQNEKLLGYWDTVADRLYKIRHCMNIEGVARQLALFQPQLNPAALVKAVAGGAGITAALGELNTPLPLYRFSILLQKANELCSDLKALGAALLAALEKQDAEELGQQRQSQEIRLLEAVKAVREQQIAEAKEQLAGVNQSKLLAGIKQQYYENKEFMNALEIVSAALAGGAIGVSSVLAFTEALASVFFLLPSFNLGVSGVGGSPQVTLQWGSENIAKSIQSANSATQHGGSILAQSASLMGSIASYQRRKDEWEFQSDLAAQELEQAERQIAAAELRVAIAEQELANHVVQIENARATDAFMRSKYTNLELYQWQVGQIAGVYFQSYKLAYDLAQRAERCFRFELGLQASSYVNAGSWDSLKKGLMAGEKLQHDLRRLEAAYLEQNRREFELTKHVSLALLDPLALIKLRETGRCFLRLPEESFDLDYPGHYFRRIKSVSLSLPCVVGPYTTISCTLRLLKNSIRINTANGTEGYSRNWDDKGLPADDPRFVETTIPVKAIAASNGQNDSGVFELSFRDERYLPFEGAGAISEWALELFNDTDPDFGKPLRQFDYGTISDAVLHVKYTAREDTGSFKHSAVTNLHNYFKASGDAATPVLQMLNLRQEFPTQWHRFLHPVPQEPANVFELELSPRLFPWRDSAKTLIINTVWLLARCTGVGEYSVVMTPPLPPPPAPPDVDPNKMTLAPLNHYGGLRFSQKGDKGDPLALVVTPTDPPTIWRIHMTGPSGNLQEDAIKKVMEVEDVFVVLGYEWQ